MADTDREGAEVRYPLCAAVATTNGIDLDDLPYHTGASLATTEDALRQVMNAYGTARDE